MAWIESHQTLLNHPKTRRAARLLGIQRVHLVGHLHALWWWAMDYAPSGSLAGFDPADIADAMEWEGDPDALVDALVTCGIGDGAGFLEQDAAGDLTIHDWDAYAGDRSRATTARAEWDAIRSRVAPRVMARDGWACRNCGSRTTLEIDHIVPVRRGGGNEMRNLQTLCMPCNRRKGGR